MRWGYDPYQIGDIRITRKFLWFPEIAQGKNNVMSWRWLEHAVVKERYTKSIDGHTWYLEEWVD